MFCFIIQVLEHLKAVILKVPQVILMILHV
jgi:hypothetical protein